MALRKRTSKSVAKRHDLDYFKKGSPIRLWQWRLALLALVAAVAWIGISASRSSTAFSAGPMSAQHAVFGAKCEACHIPVVRGAGFLPVIGARKSVPDSACLNCHQVGAHFADRTTEGKSCSTCHLEHKGSMHLAATEDRGCTQCHADLQVKGGGQPRVAAHIRSFVDGHPDFTPLKLVSAEVKDSAFGLKFNHAEHMKPGLLGPGGNSKVDLQCASCHRVDVALSGKGGRGIMGEVKFDRDCRSCHSLEFDKRVAEEAPHGDPAEARKFVEMKMAQVGGGAEGLAKAEAILFRQKCSLCHTITGAEALPRVMKASFETPRIAPAKQPDRFFAASIFSHTAHQAVQCEECHAQALSSTSGSDLMMPNIATCKRCHDGQSRPQGPVLASGHAESGCFSCHVYHEGTAAMAGGTGAHNAFRIDDLVRR